MTDNTETLLALKDVDVPVVRGSMVLIVTQDGRVKNVLQQPAGVAASDLEGKTINEFWPADVSVQVRENIRRAVRSREFYTDELKHPDSGLDVELIFIVQGPDKVLLVVKDVSEQHDTLTRMQKLAYTDDATALPNRGSFLEKLAGITDHQRLKQGRAAVICLQIDNVEEHRNAFGAAQQDAILHGLADRLKSELRGANDSSVTDYERYSIVARVDFRQFAVVLPSIESGEDAEAVSTRLIGALERDVPAGDRVVRVSVFAGISLFPQDGMDAPTLFENAVAAMEDARSSQGNKIKFHSGTVRLRTLQRQDLELELRTALEREEFSISYLPVVEADSGRVRSIEALLRWPESIMGAQSTRKVVALAERTGLILPIGEWVLRRSCEQLRSLHDAGHTALRLSVNLSVQEFARADLATRVAETLLHTNVQSDDIDFEITEHMLFRDAMRGFKACQSLKKLGIGITVDDYGTGTCSLANLAESVVDGVKIDNTLTAQLENNERDSAACGAAIALAHALGIYAIAEGVETEEQARLLRELGCDFLQGYYFYPPLSPEELSEYLDNTGETQRNKAVESDRSESE